MALLNFLDLVTRNRNDQLVGLVEDATSIIVAPELATLPVTPRAGITYEIGKRVTYPTSGFRQVNQGITGSKSVYKKEVKEMYPFDCQIIVDEAIVKGDDGTLGDILTNEAAGAYQSSIISIGNQTWYGQNGDGSNGFVGLRSQIAGAVGAGGTTNSTTAYGLWLNPQGVGYDIGKSGEVSMNPFSRQLVTAPNGGTYFAWVSNINFFIGLSVKSAAAVYGVTGITTHTTTITQSFANGANTVLDQAMSDRIAAQLVSTVPLNRRNGFTWFMNKTALYTLQQGRSAINLQAANSGGTPAWSPGPEACLGFPIVVTDSLTNTENNT
jgi:hypothetical protein